MDTNLDLDRARLLFESKVLKHAQIFPAETPGKWSVQFRHSNGQHLILTAQRHNIRQFSTVDSAVKTLAKIGFATIEIHV